MNKILAFCSFGLLSMIFAACDPICEPAPSCRFQFELVNNSQDTVGYSVYGHKINMNNDDVIYYYSCNSITPASTQVENFYHWDNGDSWEGFFKEREIDTLYICIAKEVPEAKCQICKLPDKDSVLKVYKFYDKNTDLTHTVSPTITCP